MTQAARKGYKPITVWPPYTKLQLQDLQLQKKKNVTDQNKVPSSHTAYTKPQNC